MFGIAVRMSEFIRWDNRNRNAPADAWCKVTVDGTDFRVGDPVPYDGRWNSPKATGAAVKYEVAISIFSGDIVWVYGPHVGGKHDTSIFREKMRELLEPKEMVIADAGYQGEGSFIFTRKDFYNQLTKKEASQLRARGETCNRRFKQWGILKQVFRNVPLKHQAAFYAVAVLTQIDIDAGNVLFSLEADNLVKMKKRLPVVLQQNDMSLTLLLHLQHKPNLPLTTTRWCHIIILQQHNEQHLPLTTTTSKSKTRRCHPSKFCLLSHSLSNSLVPSNCF